MKPSACYIFLILFKLKVSIISTQGNFWKYNYSSGCNYEG